MAELLLARGTVAELHREAFAGQGHRGGEPSGSFCWRGAAAKVLNGWEHCGRDLSGRSCWPGAVLGASGLYLNQLRGFCFVVPCQSSK